MTTDPQRMHASCGTARVELVAPAEAVAEFGRMAGDFVRLTPAAADDRPPPALVQVATRAPRGDGWRRLAYSSDYEPDRVVWVDDARRRIAVVGEPSEWRAQQTLRSVRHLLRWQVYAAGDLLLHGGLVRMDGRGVAFAGAKRSGKTSSILSALVHGGADFVSNDDLTVGETPDGALRGYGSPRTVNVRTDALLALAESAPAVARLLTDSTHPTNSFEGRHRTAEALHTASGAALPGSLWVRAGELCATVGCDAVPESRVDAVVFPRFEDRPDGPALVRLDREQSAAELRHHMEDRGTKYDPFLADWYPHTDAARRARLCERLLDEAVFFRMSQHMHGLREATAALRDALRAVPA